ncbi:MAG: HEAT repeat domain-containing protein [Deltaproteobacteria bacterium]|nr:HEAT repeat domain-containing protein [Deltaproteobacteria bacterium]
MSTASAVVLALVLAGSQVSSKDVDQIMGTVSTGTRPEVDRAINRIQYLGTPRPIVSALVRMALGDAPGNPESALYVLSVLHPPEAGPAFLRLLDDDSGALRLASCQGLTHLKPPRGAPELVAAKLTDKVPAVRRECARTLTAWDKAPADPLAQALTKETDPDARLAELEALGHAQGKASVAALEPVLASKSEQERYAAARALAMLGAPSGRKALEGYLASLDPNVRADAVDLTAAVNASWATEDLATRLDDPSAHVCIRAGRALAARKDKRGVEALVLRAERASPDDKFAFETALAELKINQAQRLDIIQKAGRAK